MKKIWQHFKGNWPNNFDQLRKPVAMDAPERMPNKGMHPSGNKRAGNGHVNFLPADACRSGANARRLESYGSCSKHMTIHCSQRWWPGECIVVEIVAGKLLDGQ